MGAKQTTKDATPEPVEASEPVAAPAPAPAPAPVSFAAPAVASSSGGVSTSTLLLLLVVCSVLSSALSPLVQVGLKRTAEAYLGLSPEHVANLQLQQQGYAPPQSQPAVYSQPAQQQQQQQQQPKHVQLAARGLVDESTYVCKHNYRAVVAHRDPMVMILEDFLQPGEAEHMIAVAGPQMQRSRVFGESIHSEARTSSSAYLAKTADHVIKCIEERASLVSNITVADTEPLQVVWYKEGQEFRPHFDYVSTEDLKRDYWTRFGQRYVTILVYLNEPTEGGSTIFPKLGLDFAPKKNAAVFWYNVGLNDREDERTLHGGAPVKGGEKYAINIWQRKMLPHVSEILREKAAQEAQKNADPSQRVGYATEDQKAEAQSGEKHKEEL